MSNKENNTPLIYSKLILVMRDIEYVGKKGQNTSQGYGFRKADDVDNHLHPLFAKHGIIVIPEVLEDRSEERLSKHGSVTIYRILKIKHTYIAAEDGSSISAVTMGEGMDTGDKASNKAMTASRKYSNCQVLCIPTDDPKDPENDSHDLKKNDTTQNKPQVTHAPKQVIDSDLDSYNPPRVVPLKYQPSFEGGAIDAEDFVVDFGKFKGSKFKSLPINEVKNYAAWLQKSAKKDGKSLFPSQQKFVTEAEKLNVDPFDGAPVPF